MLGPLARDRQRFKLLDKDYEALGGSRRIDQISMSPPPAGPSFTPKQGQYLAYTRVLGRPPAEADLQRHFGVSPPSVHQMVLTLERAGLIRRRPGIARSIEVLIAPEFLPILR